MFNNSESNLFNNTYSEIAEIRKKIGKNIKPNYDDFKNIEKWVEQCFDRRYKL